MKRLLSTFAMASAFAATLLFSSSYVLANEKASQANVERLLTLMNASQMVDAVYTQMEAMTGQMRSQMQVTEAEMPIFEKYNGKIYDLLREKMNWETMKPEIAAIYANNFTDQEIEGLIEFYQSDVGQTFIQKMPAITQESMQMSQRLVMTVVPSIQAISQELGAELQAARQKASN